MLWLPVALGGALAGGIYLGSMLHAPKAGAGDMDKLSEVIDYISREYVDTLNRNEMVDISIDKMLSSLDPHSEYIPASELQAATEPLEGNFEGIGIEFHIQDDTVMVVSAISGGPSEQAGILPGDRIVKVDGKDFGGSGMTNEKVLKTLRGKGGTKVKLTLFRRGQKKLIDYEVIRGTIPIYSLDIAYLPEPGLGYIKLSRFALNTYDEFREALEKLNNQGMKKLILDLRGNPGGYLDAATRISDEFLDGRKMIVYTEGKARPRSEYRSQHTGLFEKGDLVILIDEGSASASEIVAGAVQDWDRGIIVGRRSFGKGLVQEQTMFGDSSAIRLTIARYYTPTGRSIQKPYSKDEAAYEAEVFERFNHGEMKSADSVRINREKAYKTPGGKTVYGGGGISPDVFIPIDTIGESAYLTELWSSGVLTQYAYVYADRNRDKLSAYKTATDYRTNFTFSETDLKVFTDYASKNGVLTDREGLQISGDLIRSRLKAYTGRIIFKNEGFYPVLHADDPAFQKARDLLKEKP